jgi:hypothetical protein
MRTTRKQKWWTTLRCGRTWGVGGYMLIKTEKRHVVGKLFDANKKAEKLMLDKQRCIVCKFGQLSNFNIYFIQILSCSYVHLFFFL